MNLVQNTKKLFSIFSIGFVISSAGCGDSGPKPRPSFLRHGKEAAQKASPSPGELQVIIKNNLSHVELNAEIGIPSRFLKDQAVVLSLLAQAPLRGTIPASGSESYIVPADRYADIIKKSQGVIVLRFNDSLAPDDSFLPCAVPHHEISMGTDLSVPHILRVEVTAVKVDSYTCVIR